MYGGEYFTAARVDSVFVFNEPEGRVKCGNWIHERGSEIFSSIHHELGIVFIQSEIQKPILEHIYAIFFVTFLPRVGFGAKIKMTS